MNAQLVCELTIVVTAGMQGYMGVGNIMTEFSGIFENEPAVFLAESACEPAEHGLHPPGNNAIDPQGIRGKFFRGLFVIAGKPGEGIGTIVIDIHKMMRPFRSHYI